MTTNPGATTHRYVEPGKGDHRMNRVVGDYAGALAWLATIEAVGGELPAALEARRRTWATRMRSDKPGVQPTPASGIALGAPAARVADIRNLPADCASETR